MKSPARLSVLLSFALLSLHAQTVIIDSHDAAEIGTGTFTHNSTRPRDKAGQYPLAGVTGSYLLATGQSATWTPTLTAGSWLVEVWNPTDSTSMVSGTTSVTHASGSTDYAFVQHALGGSWTPLGFHQFNAGSGGNVTTAGPASGSSFTYADAVRFTSRDELPTASFELGSTFARTQDASWFIGSKKDNVSNTAGEAHSFTLNITPGDYALDYHYLTGIRSSDTTVEVWDGASKLSTLVIDQSLGSEAFTSMSLGTFSFSGGTAEIRTIASGNGFASVSGVDIIAIPEPGTLALLGIALGALVLFRRRKR